MTGRMLVGQRVGVFGKGGAGKSTVAVFLARALQERGYDVLVLDADSTSEGLAGALGAPDEPVPLLHLFGGPEFGGGQVTSPLNDPSPLPGARLAVAEIPERFLTRSPDGVRLMVAGKVGDLGPGAGCDGPVAKIARDVRVEGLGPAPVVILDFKAGFEDVARGVITTLDWALPVVDPTLASIQLARHVRRLVEAMRAGARPATGHLARKELAEIAEKFYREAPVRSVLPVLNRVPSPTVERRMRAALEEEAEVVGVFDEEPGVDMQWFEGRPLASARLLASARGVAVRLERRMLMEAGEGWRGPVRTPA